MAQPGKIATQGNRQLIFDTKKSPRWFRITNTGANVMGVTYTDEVGSANLSIVIKPNNSMDFFALRIDIRDDSGNGVSGIYEGLP